MLFPPLQEFSRRGSKASPNPVFWSIVFKSTDKDRACCPCRYEWKGIRGAGGFATGYIEVSLSHIVTETIIPSSPESTAAQ